MHKSGRWKCLYDSFFELEFGITEFVNTYIKKKVYCGQESKEYGSLISRILPSINFCGIDLNRVPAYTKCRLQLPCADPSSGKK